jgi:hypothetical protein
MVIGSAGAYAVCDFTAEAAAHEQWLRTRGEYYGLMSANACSRGCWSRHHLSQGAAPPCHLDA